MKRLLPLLIILFTFSAAAFTTSLEAEKQQASPEEPAEFNLNINNTDLYNHTYSVSLISPKSSWIYYPQNKQVDANSDEDLMLTVSPVQEAIQQRYKFDLKIREDTGETREQSGFFHVKQPYNVQITSLEQSTKTLLPGEKLNTSIRIKNLDNMPLQDYTVVASYRGDVKTRTGTQVLAGGERRFKYSFQVPENAAPEENNIKYRITAPETDRTAEQTFTVEKTENIEKEKAIDDKLLVKTVTLSAENTGNAEAKAVVKAEISSYLEPFTAFSSNPEKKESDPNKYAWTQTLGPDQSFSETYTVSYWQPILVIALLLAGIAAIKKIGGNVKLKKTAGRSDGEIKVKLEITNKSDKTFEEAQLVEFIPNIAEVNEKFDMNQPETRDTDDGTRIEWKVEELEPGDQRIIQYKIKPRIQVEEEVTLKAAVLKDVNGQKISKSNSEDARFNPDTS